MDSDDLTPEQAAALRERIGPMLGPPSPGPHSDGSAAPFAQRFAPTKVQAAVDALHRLHVDPHYRSCLEQAG